MYIGKEMSVAEVCSHGLSDTQIRSLWYDWFCRESSLVNKGATLLRKLRVISKSSKFDAEKTYVFFKNNCPCYGSLYDDFRICDMETGDVLYTVVPSSGFTVNKGKAQVYGRENNFEEPLVEGSWKDVKNFFLGK